MEILDATRALAALAQPTRLAIFRHLVAIGPDGTPAGRIAEKFGLPGATLSFHLAQLSRAELVGARRSGRVISYAASFATMAALLEYLTRQCCGGRPEICGPAFRARKPKRARRKPTYAPAL